ncbi:GNAT family N-acetyltransferase [Chthonomonas calidirosea]|uniref:GNAT family N-acetyltransferase n=1 Tax=Chthonomonas calidirosea TaxID=454171 RepID=UPI0006ECAF4D|nr:GNAT family N-acetyltransferase [Chthonomonas calidirosea]CEK18701.1 predicted acetyltransferase [Chthonomonas calidirosea]
MGFEVRAVRPEEREACLDLWCRVWSENGRGFFHRYLYADETWLPHYTQVGVLDGKIVSAVQIVRRKVACGEIWLTMGGLANVATLPEYRGQGYNTACLKRALAIMEAEGMDFSALSTGIPGYYERIGYTVFPLPEVEGAVRQPLPSGSADIGVRAARADDLPIIRAIYASYNRHRPLTLERTQSYWSYWIGLSEERDPKEVLVGLDREGHVIAYLCYSTFEREGQRYGEVREIGLADMASAQAEQVLFNLLATLCWQEEIGFLRAHIALDPEVCSALERILEKPIPGYHRGGMLRLLHRTELFQKLLPRFEQRWIEQGRPAGRVSFETPYGPISLEGAGEALILRRMEGGEGVLPQVHFFQLLFGTVRPHHVTEDGAQRRFLEALFPRGKAPVFYRADGF